MRKYSRLMTDLKRNRPAKNHITSRMNHQIMSAVDFEGVETPDGHKFDLHNYIRNNELEQEEIIPCSSVKINPTVHTVALWAYKSGKEKPQSCCNIISLKHCGYWALDVQSGVENNTWGLFPQWLPPLTKIWQQMNVVKRIVGRPQHSHEGWQS